MTKPKKPIKPPEPNYLNEDSKQTQVIYSEQSSYLDISMSIVDIISDHAEKNFLSFDNYDWQSIVISISQEYTFDGKETSLEILCDLNIDSHTLEKIKEHNKSLRIEWEAKNQIYLEKLKLYEAELKIWEQTERGQSAKKKEELKKINKLVTSKIIELTEKFHKGLLSQEELAERIGKIK